MTLNMAGREISIPNSNEVAFVLWQLSLNRESCVGIVQGTRPLLESKTKLGEKKEKKGVSHVND